MTNAFVIQKDSISSARITLAGAVPTRINLPASTRLVLIRTALDDVKVACDEDPADLAILSGGTINANQFSKGGLVSPNEWNSYLIQSGNLTNIRLRSEFGGDVDVVAVEIQQESNVAL